MVNPNSIDPRVLCLLQQIALHRAITRESLAWLVKAGDGEQLLRKALDDKLIFASRSLPGGRSVYQLTRAGVAAAGVSAGLYRRHGTQALIKHLGVLSLCGSDPENCFRLAGDDVDRVLKTPAPEGVHVLTLEAGVVRLGWCYVPWHRAAVESVTRRIRDHLQSALNNPALKQWIEDRRYIVVVVVESAQRERAVKRALQSVDKRGRPPLMKMGAIWVHCPAGFDAVIGAQSASAIPPSPATGTRRSRAQANSERDRLKPAVPTGKAAARAKTAPSKKPSRKKDVTSAADPP